MNTQQFSMPPTFWQSLDNLISTSDLVIDRPKGSAHPRYPEMIYPLDYGYLKGTSAGDGNEIDVWLGSDPDRRLVGVAVTVDLNKRDSEIKVLIGLTEEEISEIEKFHNRGWQSAIIIRRTDPAQISKGTQQ